MIVKVLEQTHSTYTNVGQVFKSTVMRFQAWSILCFTSDNRLFTRFQVDGTVKNHQLPLNWEVV